MQKFLFATTAIVGFTGLAHAQVNENILISGNAEMGIAGGEVDDNDDDLDFHTDIDVTFTMSGETDTGLGFGASVDLSDGIGNADAASGATDNNDDDGGITVFLSGDFGTVTMGDTDGAFDFAMEEVPVGSSINDAQEHAGYNGNSGLDGSYDGQVLRYDYTFDAFSVAASAEIRDDETGPDDEGEGDTAFGIGVKYTLTLAGTDVTFGAGYQSADDAVGTVADLDNAPLEDPSVAGISLGATVFNDVNVGLNYSRFSGDDADVDHFGIGASYAAGQLTVAANYGIFTGDVDGDDADPEASGFGLAAAYDLGGGAEFQVGYGDSDRDLDDGVTDVDSTSYSAGFRFNF